MPRQQRPPAERAVTASRLFRLPSEVRIMIYELLLIQKRGICIPSDTFVRRDYGRTDSGPCECLYCGLLFLSDHGCRQHIAKNHCHTTFLTYRYLPHLHLPDVTTSLLRTCRIIRLEASPILYSKNIFHFDAPSTASNFRWSTDSEATKVQEIRIKLGSEYYQRVSRWVTYFTKQELSFGRDFSHLKRLTIDLAYWIGQESAHLLRSMSEGFKERPQRLEWVLILRLNQEKVLDCFEPLIDSKVGSKNGGQEVRRYVSGSKNGEQELRRCVSPGLEQVGDWKDAILWWGSPGEVVPQKYKLLADQRQPKGLTEEERCVWDL